MASSSSTIDHETTPNKANKMSLGSILLWGVALIIIGVLGYGMLTLNEAPPEVGAQAPDFAISFFDGYEWEEVDSATLSQMAGKPVVLNFWASWCVECRLEADLLQATSQQYADDVIFLGIAWTDTEPKSLAYLEEFGITYPNAPDLGLDIGRDYEVTGVPETYFINREGEIVHRVIGPVTVEIMDGVMPMLAGQ